jgi:hypothetical protein
MLSWYLEVIDICSGLLRKAGLVDCLQVAGFVEVEKFHLRLVELGCRLGFEIS